METTTEKNTPKEEPKEELYIEPNPTEEEVEEQIRVMEMVEQAMTEAEDNIIKLNYTGTLIHKGFSEDDLRQKYVQYAYKLGGMDFVKLIECEAGNWSIFTKGDSGHAWGLCQLNDNYHKVSKEYKNTWQVQIETCYKKRKGGTKFYGPNRIIKGQKCSSYVSDRFILE